MSNTLAQMTKSEFKQLLSSLIEEKLAELVGDPDEGLPIRKSLRDRLLRQKALVDRGDYGLPFEKALKEAGLSNQSISLYTR
jgi:hypothetical protein